ncbi:hypothetical protein K461DRAFT_311063 [Myriangium duriaei CBS 260.36]|uniref:Altered inheritance of mitochondria protein 9, mitochondrial n=1 Tax=Myriangium duriaei CBS 260.36 TaxID=1168546 RepID=A0A9P4J725_9PEZI|nr:hypothetical protein K461DRAFT_311063 [Myriangium duriaei CBS 260.36]
MYSTSRLCKRTTAVSSSSIAFSTTSRYTYPPLADANTYEHSDSTPIGQKHSKFDEFDPFNHTSGRWLRRDRLQRKSRELRFNFRKLCDRVKSVSGFRSEISFCNKIGGAVNWAFVFTFACGSEIVARLPTSISGPAHLITNSEVATTKFLQRHTSIPIPRILVWSDDPQNGIMAEYIIMEKVPGVQLSTQWGNMTGKQHLTCIKNIAKMVNEMARLDLPAYGSLYFRRSPTQVEKAFPVDDDFFIGPNCSPIFWSSAPGEAILYGNQGTDRGTILQTFSSGLIASAQSRLPDKSTTREINSSDQGTIDEHHSLISEAQRLLSLLSETKSLQEVSVPLLMHPDLNRRNIFVSRTDPTKITGLIDWQATCSIPTLMYGPQIPDFAMLPEQVVDDGDGDDAPIFDEKTRKDMMLCHDAFEVLMKGYCPTFAKARLLNYNYIRLFHNCNTSWRDGATALRSDLMDIRDSWGKLGVGGDCPYQPSSDEIEQHKKQYEDVEISQALKSQVIP